MDQAQQIAATLAGEGPMGAGGMGHPDLVHLDQIRLLFLRTGLSPEPNAYHLFWLYVTGADAALSRDLERIMEEGAFGPETIHALRQSHLGELAAAELHELVEAAQASADRLADRLETGLGELRTYDKALADGDAAIGVSQTVAELAGLVQDLRRANAVMMAANRRLEADVLDARMETARILDRLDEAEQVARTDPLTGMANRRGILEELKAAMKRTAETGRPLAIGLVDIDHFKRVNDQWGHAIGDEVLRCIGGHLANHAKKAGNGAIAGRQGGEEFLMLLPGMSLQQAAAAIDAARAQLVRQVIRRATDGASLGRISFSAGVAMQRPEDSADMLVDRADSALYAAKRAGRDRVLPEQPARG